MRTLKTYSPFGLNIEECLTNPMQKYKCYWWAYLFVCFFFGILVRPGTDLEQDFLDMAFIFLYFLYCLFPYY